MDIFQIPPLVGTEMTADRNDKKITAEEMIKGLINGLNNDHYTIRVGDAKIFSFIRRFFPKKTYNIISPKKSHQLVKN